MKVLNDFLCNHCGWAAELLEENTTKSVDCLDCGGSAFRVLSVPNFQLPGNDPAGFPTAYDQWAKKRDQKIAQEKKSENSYANGGE